MGRSGTLASEVALAALYLRGGPERGPLRRARWCLVRDVLQRSTPSLTGLSEALRDNGLWDEATVAGDRERIDWALALVENGRALTAASDDYPERWTRVLGTSAPPALWKRGRMPAGDTVSMAGSREPGPSDLHFVAETAEIALASGLSVVSGGARGVDRAAERTAATTSEGRTAVIYPCGLDAVDLDPRVCQLSLCEPWSGFSSAQAMERNTLIYASSPLTVVVRPRFRAGGTWAGAVEAIRRRSSKTAVWGPEGDEAVEALIRLGAARMTDPLALSELFRAALAGEREAVPRLDGFA